jgi:uncharacterized membrane protein YhaH (DUF805 family)
MESIGINTEDLFAAIGPVVVVLVAIFLVLLSLAAVVIKAVICCRIFHKAGYAWVLGLLMLVPVAGMVMPFILAFGHWPIERQIEELLQQQKGAPFQPAQDSTE